MRTLLRLAILAAVVAVVAILSSDTAAAPSAFPPLLQRNGSLAYVDGGFPAIWLMHGDGTDKEQFIPGQPGPAGAPPILHPRWSPDGKQLAFTAGMDVHVLTVASGEDDNVGPAIDPSWTPEGDLLVSAGGDIFRVDLSGGSRTNLTNTAGVDETEPAESPDGMWIAFSSNQDTSADPVDPTPGLVTNLWIMNTTDLITSQRVLWEDTEGRYFGSPSWAPDSQELTFSDNGDIWTSPPDGNSQTNLTNDAPIQVSPDWSPDGTQIAYSEQAQINLAGPQGFGPAQIWTIGVFSNERENLTNDNNSRATMPDWQPWPVVNGRIYFQEPGSNFGLVSVLPDGTHEQPLFAGRVLPSPDQVSDMQASPDGTRLGAVSGDQGTFAVADVIGLPDITFETASDVVSFAWFPSGLHVILANKSGDFIDHNKAGQDLNITNTPDVTESSPAVSPDGMHIAYFSDQVPGSDPPTRGNSIGLWTMDFDGLNRQFLLALVSSNLIVSGAGHQVTWSPDGKKIAYVSGLDVWTVDPDGSNPTNLTDDSVNQVNITWSPDGRLIAFDQIALLGSSQIWAIDPVTKSRQKIIGGNDQNVFMPTWQPVFAPGSDRHFIWGDYACTGQPKLENLLYPLQEIAGIEPQHVPGCPWMGEEGLTQLNTSGPWGDTTCDDKLDGKDVINFFDYWLGLGDYNFDVAEPAGGLLPTCPLIGQYPEIIPTG
jgi:Tol biopolymer transport system component